MKEANFFCFILNICITALLGALLPLLPALTRKSFLFGVKIPLEEQNCLEAKSMKKNYIMICLTGAAAILALVIIQYTFIPDATLISTLYFPLLFVAVQAAGFIPNWKKSVRLKEARGWKISDSVYADTKSSHTRGNLSELPWIWYILSLFIIITGFIIALVEYPDLPDRIPTHFGFDMQPDAWSDKSLSAILQIPLINSGTLLIMWLTGFMLIRAKRQIDPQKPELSFAQHSIYRRRIGNCAGVMTLGLTAGLALMGLYSIFPDLSLSFGLLIFILFAPVVPLVVVSIVSGQGGCRIKPKMIDVNHISDVYRPTSPAGAIGRGDDRYWALGMFYHNPDDPAYLIEDRFGSNLGFNYSRLPVKIGVTAILLVLIAIYVWATISLW